MAWSSYEDLDVFKKAYAFALGVHRLTATFPKEELYSLTSQIRRSSKSVCANIVEGHGKSYNSPREFFRFLNMSLGSVDETKLWLKFAVDLGYLSQEDWISMNKECIDIARMLHGLMKSLNSQSPKTANSKL